MHYIGMSALDASTYIIHDPLFVAASMAIAIAASGLALWLATRRAGRPPLILSAMVFGIAVSAMHYTAMAGVTLYPYVTSSSGVPALSTDLLAIVVAVVAFCISGMFLLLLLPDSSRSASHSVAVLRGGLGNDHYDYGNANDAVNIAGWGRRRQPRIRARNLCAARWRGCTAAALCASSSNRAPRGQTFRCRGGCRRGSCQCALHLHLRRQRHAVLPARHRRRRIAARQ